MFRYQQKSTSRLKKGGPAPDPLQTAIRPYDQQDSGESTESSRHEAINGAKRDAGVPTSQQPEKQETVPVTDSNGKQVVVNGKPQTSREYTHTTGSGQKVVIQNHGQGHTFADGAKVGPHVNVRPADNTRNGEVPGTKAHYPYKKQPCPTAENCGN